MITMETWELTEYEQERQPQELNIDQPMISPRSLSREMLCPVCLDVLHQTRAAPDCLHRFCTKCIEKIIKKECPVCRKKLPSKLNGFRLDPNFDLLIAKITNSPQLAKPVDNRQLQVPECEIVLRHLHGEQTRYIKCSEQTTIDHLRRYLAIRPEGAKMPNLENDEEYKLCIEANRSTGHYQMLDGNLKLEDLKNTYNLDLDKPLELYFYSPPGR